jgi:hypothetical protein
MGVIRILCSGNFPQNLDNSRVNNDVEGWNNQRIDNFNLDNCNSDMM